MAVLKIDHVSKVFEEHGQPHVVLKDVCFEVHDKEFVCLLGPSGCGKTTLLSMMGGFQLPTSGQILLDSEPVTCPAAERGYVFQNYALFPWMNVRKNIAYALRFLPLSRKEKDERVKNLIRLAHLEGNEEKYPVMLSGGMQQRVAVARALAGQPKALMMDEPLGAIDFQMRELMQNDLDQMIRETGITTVMVTHDVAESVFFSDRVIVMSGFEGQILEDLHIDLPKPRNRESPEFNRLQTHLSSLLRRAFADRDKYRVLSEQK
ncbi:MAG: ABC transporter ATP-binding protein [Pyramidobacter sp.]|jgi:NitT/TauT family transport system ATP-binding protein